MMRVLKIATIIVLGVGLIACSSARRSDIVTLESLEKRKIKVNPQDLPSANKEDAQKRYAEFAKSTSDQEMRAVAMERLADIELESGQARKFRESELKEAENRARKGSVSVVDDSKLGDYSNVARQYEKLIKRYPDSKDN